MKLTIALFSLMLSVFIIISVSAQGQTGQHHQMMQQQTPNDSTFGYGMMGYGNMYPGMMGYGMMGSGGLGYGMMGYGMMGYGGMGYGMMGYGMMGGTAALYEVMITINELPDLKSSLDLTEPEIDQLNKLQSDYLKQRIDWNADIQKQMVELNQAVKKQTATAQVKKMLQTIADIQVTMYSGAYDTYQKMLAILTPGQKKQLDSLDLSYRWQRGNRGHRMPHQKKQ
ncbi:MAG: Spy/CpxP family protein refolding chaperone [Calditrichota bacterium]